MKRSDGELILLCTLPVVALIWVSAFFLFPGFVHPMSPTLSADEVASFYRDETARIRYSMILFNWFGVAVIPILLLIAERMRASVEAMSLAAINQRLTISLGVATRQDVGDVGTAWEMLLKEADAHLYRAKSDGRNRFRD